MARQIRLAAVVAVLISSPACAALVLSQNDSGSAAIYQNGGGNGFGGTLGGGAITMDVQGSNLVVGFLQGNNLNDIVTLFLDTRAGGFVDAQMDDQADGSRRALSNLTPNGDDSYPAGVSPDFGITFGNFGTVLFELNAGNTPGHLNFLQFNGFVGSITIPLATLSNPAQIDFFAGYTADSGFNSNESLPFSAGLNGAGNPGFGDGSPRFYDNFNRFITTAAVPEASTFFVFSLVFASAACVRRRFY